MHGHDNVNTTKYGFATRAIHAGQHPDPHTGAVMVPISLSTTFAQVSPGVAYPAGYEYSRSGNPTRQAFEDCIASLENAKYGLAFSSGLAATTTILHTLKPGDHVVSVDDVYGGTQRYFRRIASEYGITFTFVDFNDAKTFEASIQANTKMIWLETPTNPTLKISDISIVAEIAHRHNAVVVVDNTFMSPYFQNPLDLGADIVVHSVTKYLNGHSDVVMGALATNDDALYEKLKFFQNAIGTVPSPFDSFLAVRGLKTLPLRMQQHEKNATAVAKFLEAHPKVDKVLYPGLPSHPQHEIAKKQMRGFGGMITFFIKGGLPQAKTFLENLKVFALAESLGGVESLAEHPAIMTHASVPAEERKKLGINDTLIRLSVGCETTEDIVTDIANALDKVELDIVN
eukprot:GEZU01038776.1.p1 GENE.GEZU01038776.1~~GEZU01038776.1.p1  ORF type:complete len:422 (-),score=159.06 GEZU01038776.1:109-1308(-)